MDRTGVIDKRGTCQISFMYMGQRYRPVLRGFRYSRASDRKAAAQRLATVQREIQLGTFYFPDHFPDHPAASSFRKGHQIAIKQALQDFLREKRSQIEATTYRGYEKDVLYHLIPTFGHFRLSELRTTDVRRWLESLNVCGKTKNNILIPLRAIFRQAFRDDRIERDPIEKIPNFSHRSKEPDPLSTAEIEAVLGVARGQIRNVIEFAIWTGLRTSELIAVRWQDVDLVAGKVHVRMTRTSQGEKDHGKTATSTRTLELHPYARDALTRQLEFTAGKIFVFENPSTGQPWKHDGPYRKIAWTPTLALAGVRYRPAYQTRHTFASQLLSAGIDPTYIAGQLGHRDWAMLRKTYGRWMPERSQGERDKISKLWAPQGHQNHEES
ncbi:MAG: tyrosine-type recombinase/integrase [Proteobacteria bacterium]|nr:tyrosine-type recombinase/integrase [Pseudomonadota bacterium]